MAKKSWALLGFDAFEGEEYPLAGEYPTEEAARAAAKKNQPTASSGGQGWGGIQDRVMIVRPDGTKYRFRQSA